MLKVLIKHLVYEKCIQVFFDTVYKNFVSVKYDFDVGDLVEFKTKIGESLFIKKKFLCGAIHNIQCEIACVSVLEDSELHMIRRHLSELHLLTKRSAIYGQNACKEIKTIFGPNPYRTGTEIGTLGPAEHRIKVYRDNFGGKEPTLVGFKAKIT